jgi:hypothetical protein
MASAMRRQAHVWAMEQAAPKPLRFPEAQGAACREGNNALGAQWARRGAYPAGCSTMARRKRTVQEPGRPAPLLDPCPVVRRAGDPSPTHDTLARARVVGLSGTAQAPASREATGQGTRRRGRGGQGVGGLQRSEDVGEPGDPWTRPSTGGPCRWDLQQGTRAHALTVETRSPGLVKGVETV